MSLQNSAKGKIFYGMHFYSGLAEYAEPGKEPYRVYLNEDTLRSMDPSFAGRPIYVDHVDGVEDNIALVRENADGWVVESFYNSADGKHWAKMIIVSEEAEKAIANGMRLSNAYIPNAFANGGIWNGIQYTKEITGGEFEHLAIVRNPRYEESVIMTPEQFKQYNENKLVELKRLSNSTEPNKPQGEIKMAFSLFKRTKVENSTDIEGMSVVLPKSKKEITLADLITNADEKSVDMNSGLADLSHKVKMHDGSYCNVGELMEKHKSLNDELEALKAPKPEAPKENAEEEKPEAPKENAKEDEEDKKKANEEKEIVEAKKNAKEKALALKNAHLETAVERTAVVEFSMDAVARGKKLY